MVMVIVNVNLYTCIAQLSRSL